MSAPRRRIIRPPVAPPVAPAQPLRQLAKLRARLEKERVALARWQTRFRRAFHAIDRLQRAVSRIEQRIARLEES
jgi:exonuclease VII small subunit